MLLCKIHHKVVDDQTSSYSEAELRRIKAAHIGYVRGAFKSSHSLEVEPRAFLPAIKDVHDRVPQFAVDLDHDGEDELLTFELVERFDFGEEYQARVTRGGETIWTSPRSKERGAHTFGMWADGIVFPELLADVDADGSIELVVPMLRSDVSPAGFNIYRWIHNEFRLIWRGQLMEMTADSGSYRWTHTVQSDGRWIDQFVQCNRDGTVDVRVVETGPGSHCRSGMASVYPVANGYGLREWLNPLSATTAHVGADQC